MSSVSNTRLVLGAAGLALGAFGIYRLLTQVPGTDLISLLVWLVAAVILHDVVVAPVTAALGWGLEHAVPPRARRAVTYGLTAAVAVTVVALPEIYRHDNPDPGPANTQKALLLQNYGANLAIALGIVAAIAVAYYAISLLRDRTKPRPSATNTRPSDDQVSTSE